MWISMSNFKATRLKRGFTIVELLIVIVVIGILAAITIVAYSNVQSRARNTQILTAFDTFEKGLTLYKTNHGTYPSSGSPGVYCLGGNYPVTANFGAGECFKSGSTVVAQVNSTVNTALQEAILPLPSVDYPDVTFTIASVTYWARGILFNWAVANDPYIAYYLQQDGDCGRGQKIVSGQMIACRVDLEP